MRAASCAAADEAHGEALKEALAKHCTPELCDTDQGSRFTGTGVTDVLRDAKVKIPMDGRVGSTTG